MPTVIAVTDGALRTEFLMHNFGESPNAAVESTLSSILEVNAPEKYYLIAKACAGIIRRAERRVKQLPEMLKVALEQMIERERNGFTLEDLAKIANTIERHAVAYGIETFHCNTEEEKVPTLKARDWKDPHVVAYWDGTQTCGTLTANNAGGNQRMPDKENFNCVIEEQPVSYAVDCRNLTEQPELYQTLQAKPNGGQSLNFSGAVRVRYIVRRLTPTECARLQGFPDNHGHPDRKENFTDEEYSFWLNVRNTHAAINGKATKEYTKEQMLTWYNKLHTDSAEYKLWGNGIALPPALYCMQGMAEALEVEEYAER